MVRRLRSQDGRRETNDVLGEKGKVAQQGRSGGTLKREAATRDELKRAIERPAGTTRIRRKEERNT